MEALAQCSCFASSTPLAKIQGVRPHNMGTLRNTSLLGSLRQQVVPLRKQLRQPALVTCAVTLPHEVTSLVLDTSMLAFVSAELPKAMTYTVETSDFKLSQEFIKAFYMVISCVFCWGAVVFGSMNDAYYESDEYRDAGGNGTQFWMYERAEEAEEASREELWREELRQEIEEKMGEIKGLQAGEEEKVKETV